MTDLVSGLGAMANYAIMGVGIFLLLGLVAISSRLRKIDGTLSGMEPLPTGHGAAAQAAKAGGEAAPAATASKGLGHTKPASDPADAPAPGRAPGPSPEPITQVMEPSKPPAQPAQIDQGLVTQYQAGTGEGIEELEKQLEEDPENADILDWLAFMYYSNGKLEQAVSTYQRAIALNYDNEHQHYYLANAYYKLGDAERAMEEWEVVLELKPDSKLAKNAEERIRKCKEGQEIV